MTRVEFCILDSGLAPHSLLDTPYLEDGFEEQHRTYTEPSGIYLRLCGRSNDGKSVVVEHELHNGLSTSFLDERDQQTSDQGLIQAFADEVLREVLKRIDPEVLEKVNPDPEHLGASDLVTTLVEFKPAFYGFEPSPTNPLCPRKRHIVKLRTKNLRLHRAIRKIAEEALHDHPLECGARPCELAGPAHAAAMHDLGLSHGQWFRAESEETASAAADVVMICKSENLIPLPEMATTMPPLVLASYDIECSSGPPSASGGYAFPDAFKEWHTVRCIAVTTTTLSDSALTQRFFLHTGPAKLRTEDCAAVAEEEGAADAAVNLEVRHFRSEQALLHGFASLLRDELRPDILYTYNGNAFDAPFLAQRIEETMPPPLRDDERQTRYRALGMRRAAHAWGRCPMDAWKPRHLGIPKTEEEIAEINSKRAQGKVVYEPAAFDSPGMAHHDVLDFGQSLHLETGKLADVAAEVLGTSKTDLSIQEMMDIMQGGDLDGWARVGTYNIRDADLPMRIMLAKDQVAFSLQIAAVSGCSLPQVCAGGQQKRLVSMVQKEIWNRGMIFNEPSKLDFESRPWLCGGGEKVKGATVLDIQPGWYRDPVVTCDYSSLYPTIITSRNLCPSKLLLDAVPPGLAAATRTFRVEERDDDIVYHHHVIQREVGGVGVIPAITEKLLDERKKAKREMKQHEPTTATYVILDAKQQALKVICNSLYGALNAVLKGSLYCRPLGGIVTAEGRNAIAAIQAEVASVEGAEVVAGDTDSVMFKLAGRTLKQAEEIGSAVAARVTEMLRADGAHAMELSYEKTMLPSVFVAKKAYAYIKHEPGKSPTHVSMGLMSKKRGTAALFKEAFTDCERAYLLDPTSFSVDDVRRVHLLIMRDLVRRLSVEPPDAFAKTTLLKPEESYVAGYNAPHVNAARRLVATTGCTWPGNTRFKYVQAQPGTPICKSKKKASDFSMELELFKQTKAGIDIPYYLTSVHNRFEVLLRFTIPDAPDRFKLLITTHERRPTHTHSVASYFGAAAAAESVVACAADRSYSEGDGTAEVEFWKNALSSDAATPKTGHFSETWRPPRTIVVPKSRKFVPTRTVVETALLEAFEKDHSTSRQVELALQLTDAMPTDPEVAAALATIRSTPEFASASSAKEATAAAAKEDAVASKKRKLAADSISIAAQPRRGAINKVPSHKKPKAPQATIVSFFTRL